MIKNITIDWMEKWSNSPRIHIELDMAQEMWPDKDSPIWWKADNGMHLATLGILAPYFVTDGKPTQGFGGRVFEGTFVDGKKFRYIGAWSSRAACVNGTPNFPKIVDAIIGGCATGVYAAAVIEYFKAHRNELPFGLAWVDNGDMGPVLEPTRDGKLKQNGLDSRSRIIEHI